MCPTLIIKSQWGLDHPNTSHLSGVEVINRVPNTVFINSSIILFLCEGLSQDWSPPAAGSRNKKRENWEVIRDFVYAIPLARRLLMYGADVVYNIRSGSGCSSWVPYAREEAVLELQDYQAYCHYL